MNKFSEWLSDADINHTITTVKDGYIVSFIDPPKELNTAISNMMIEIDTGEEDPITHLAIVKSTNIFTASGDSIVVQERYKGQIINEVYKKLKPYIENKVKLGV